MPFSKIQIIALIGFVIVLISIPLSFTLVKKTQIFKSQASENKNALDALGTLSSKPVTKLRAVPSTSPLTDLQKLLQSSDSGLKSPLEGETTPTPTPTGTVNLAFGPTLNVKINIEGRATNNQGTKVFIGITSGAVATSPKYILTFTVDFPASGTFSGLSLAGLNPGSVYSAYIKGPAQIDAGSTFTMGPTESNLNSGQAVILLTGDLNEDNVINTADYTVARSLYGLTSASPSWNARADFNSDGVINNLDLSYIVKNFGKVGASGTWYSPNPTSSTSGTPRISTSTGGPSGSTSGDESGASNLSGYWMYVPNF